MAMFLRNMARASRRADVLSAASRDAETKQSMSIYRDSNRRIPAAPFAWVTKKRVAIVVGHLMMFPAGAYVFDHYGWQPWLVALFYTVGLRIAGYVEGIEEGRERWEK